MEKWFKSRLESILDNLIFASILAGGGTVWAIIKSLPTPAIIGISVGIFVVILAVIRVIWFFIKKGQKEDIKQIVEELLSIGIYTDVPVNITRILYHERKKLAVGLSDEIASNQDKLVLEQLNIHKIVRLEQRKVRVYGSDNVRDGGYWVLTELGNDVILYLQSNQQVLHEKGSKLEHIV